MEIRKAVLVLIRQLIYLSHFACQQDLTKQLRGMDHLYD